jgi:hypothetical protein
MSLKIKKIENEINSESREYQDDFRLQLKQYKQDFEE